MKLASPAPREQRRPGLNSIAKKIRRKQPHLSMERCLELAKVHVTERPQ